MFLISMADSSLLVTGFFDGGLGMAIGVLLGREAASVGTTNDFDCCFHCFVFSFLVSLLKLITRSFSWKLRAV